MADHIKIRGVELDKNLPIDNHINSVSKSIHYTAYPFLHI